MEATREEIEKILLWVSDKTGYDIIGLCSQINDGKFSFSGTLSQYELTLKLRNALKMYVEGEFDAASFYLKDFILDFVNKNTHDGTSEGMLKYADLLKSAVDMLRIVEKIKTRWNESAEILMYKSSPFYQGGEIVFDPRDLIAIRNSIDGRYFKLYLKKKGGNIPKTSKYIVSEGIVASDNINDLISNRQNEDTWGVTVGLLIEKKIDLSYFVITFTINGNVFVLTDRPSYTNPDQIGRLHGGGRRFSEDRERCLDFLPYILIDKVIENRKSTQSITRESGSEVWTFRLKEYFGFQMYFIICFVIDKILSGASVEELLSSSHKALMDGKVDINDMSNFSNTNREKLLEIVEEIYSDDISEAIVPTTYELVKRADIDTTMLTPKEVERFTQYIAHSDIVSMHEAEKWGCINRNNSTDMYREFDRQRTELINMFKERIHVLEHLLFASENVRIHDIDHPVIFGGFGGHIGKRYKMEFVRDGMSYGNILCAERYGSKPLCLSGDGFKMNEKKSRIITFLRYTEIATLLGVGRKGLPPLFRDYISHLYLPYSGNCILDNVTPEFHAIENDFASRHDANGFHVTVPYCGKCSNRLKKEYCIGSNGEDAVVVISSKANRIIEVITMSEFESKYI